MARDSDLYNLCAEQMSFTSGKPIKDFPLAKRATAANQDLVVTEELLKANSIPIPPRGKQKTVSKKKVTKKASKKPTKSVTEVLSVAAKPKETPKKVPAVPVAVAMDLDQPMEDLGETVEPPSQVEKEDSKPKAQKVPKVPKPKKKSRSYPLAITREKGKLSSEGKAVLEAVGGKLALLSPGEREAVLSKLCGMFNHSTAKVLEIKKPTTSKKSEKDSKGAMPPKKPNQQPKVETVKFRTTFEGILLRESTRIRKELLKVEPKQKLSPFAYKVHMYLVAHKAKFVAKLRKKPDSKVLPFLMGEGWTAESLLKAVIGSTEEISMVNNKDDLAKLDIVGLACCLYQGQGIPKQDEILWRTIEPDEAETVVITVLAPNEEEEAIASLSIAEGDRATKRKRSSQSTKTLQKSNDVRQPLTKAQSPESPEMEEEAMGSDDSFSL